MPREHPLALHRLVPFAVVVVLAVVASLAIAGPGWYRRMYHPLGHRDTIAAAAKESGVDPYLVAAVINVESGHRSGQVSTAGAVGLMQILPSTAREVIRRNPGLDIDVEALAEPENNIRIGTAYLGSLVERYGAADVALAAYNAGATNADRWLAESSSSGRPFVECISFPATERYVTDTLGQREVYKELYPEAF